MKIILNNVRLSFPHLFTADSVQENGTPRFTAAFLFEKNHEVVPLVKKAIVEVAKDKWGQKYESVLKQVTANGKALLKDGDTKADIDGYSGMYFINAANPKRPLVVDRDMTALTEEDGKIYAGCYVNAEIRVWAMDDKNNGKGIFAKILGVQFVRNGEAFGDDGKTSFTALPSESYEEEFSF